MAGLLASSLKMRSILCPLMPPLAFTDATHALYTIGMSWTPEARGPVQAHTSPILIGAPLAPAADGDTLRAVTTPPTISRPSDKARSKSPKFSHNNPPFVTTCHGLIAIIP